MLLMWLRPKWPTFSKSSLTIFRRCILLLIWWHFLWHRHLHLLIVIPLKAYTRHNMLYIGVDTTLYTYTYIVILILKKTLRVPDHIIQSKTLSNVYFCVTYYMDIVFLVRIYIFMFCVYIKCTFCIIFVSKHFFIVWENK